MSERAKAITGVLIANFFFGTSVIAVKQVSPALLHPMALTSIRIFLPDHYSGFYICLTQLPLESPLKIICACSFVPWQVLP